MSSLFWTRNSNAKHGPAIFNGLQSDNEFAAYFHKRSQQSPCNDYDRYIKISNDINIPLSLKWCLNKLKLKREIRPKVAPSSQSENTKDSVSHREMSDQILAHRWWWRISRRINIFIERTRNQTWAYKFSFSLIEWQSWTSK